MLVLTLIQCFFEVIQIIDGDCHDVLAYFKNPHNYNDMFQYLATLWIVVTNLSDVSLTAMMNKRVLCVFVIISQGINAVLDWLRLLDNTSFYVTLI